jgi:hypothetical protein
MSEDPKWVFSDVIITLDPVLLGMVLTAKICLWVVAVLLLFRLACLYVHFSHLCQRNTRPEQGLTDVLTIETG